jgi:hypothetical protein
MELPSLTAPVGRADDLLMQRAFHRFVEYGPKRAVFAARTGVGSQELAGAQAGGVRDKQTRA